MTELKNYKPELNELGEIKIDTSHLKRKHSFTRRGYLKFLGYLILIVIIILGFVLPAFIPTNEKKEKSAIETE